LPELAFAFGTSRRYYGARLDREGYEAADDRLQGKVRELVRSGKFHGLRPIVFELRFEKGYEEAREWFHDAAVRDELDRLCQGAARAIKDEAA
jgi:hypothetical protein